MINQMVKKWVFWIWVASFILLVAGLAFLNNYELGICYSNQETNTFDPSCHLDFLRLGDMLVFPMGVIAIVSLILLFVPQAVSRWSKFAIWYVPFAAYAIAVAGPVPGQMFDLSPSVQETALWLSGIYILVSLILIVLSLRKKN